MAEERFPLLRGHVTRVETYQSPRGGGGSEAKLPSLQPDVHRKNLFRQLDAIDEEIKARPEDARDELASREIIAVRPAPGTKLEAKPLGDKRTDARLIGVVETGTVLLDVKNPRMEHLRKKVEDFADDTKVEEKKHRDGSVTMRRPNEKAIAPIGTVALAGLDDIRGPRLRSETLVEEQLYWFEIACRGGYRCPNSETQGSRTQIARQLYAIGAHQALDEFIAPEHVYFFVRLSRQHLDALLEVTDCIYEAELAPPPLRDLRLFDDISTRDIQDFSLQQPDTEAPAVVLLDTGISTHHPLLKSAILSATTAGTEIPSPEDTYGHGTKMAGIALYQDLGAAIERGNAQAPHWLQSSRLLVKPGAGTAADENYEKWPVLTLSAVTSAEAADPHPRDRVFTLAITRSMQEPPLDGLQATLWSHAADQIAYNEGDGRLLIVSAGNARDREWMKLAEQYPQLYLSEKIHQPAQAANVLTVGAYTSRVELPNLREYGEYGVVAKRPGGISPYTSTGLTGSEWSIKPDIVMEGGNLAISKTLTDAGVPTLCALTTSHGHTRGRPLGQISMTSEASARASHLAARIWAVEPRLRPETVRALLVHSARWTPEMCEQFQGINDRLLACGYGVPNEELASACARNRATVVIEDAMPNAVVEQEPKKSRPKRPQTSLTEPRIRRKVKLYRLPIPVELLDDSDPDVELRVTLSYFAEPNKFGRRVFHGLDLKWDMQGPQESEDDFLERINMLNRAKTPSGGRTRAAKTKGFNWEIGPQARSRGTVQSDRWRGRMSAIAGDKLIAVVPVLGWWDQRKNLETQEMKFSLVVSVFGPGVYTAIKPRVEAAMAILVEN